MALSFVIALVMEIYDYDDVFIVKVTATNRAIMNTLFIFVDYNYLF